MTLVNGYKNFECCSLFSFSVEFLYDSLLERTEDFPKCVKRQTSGHFFIYKKTSPYVKAVSTESSPKVFSHIHTHVSKCSRHGQKLLLTAPDTLFFLQSKCSYCIPKNGCIQLQKITIITTPFGMVAAEFYSIFSK